MRQFFHNAYLFAFLILLTAASAICVYYLVALLHWLLP